LPVTRFLFWNINRKPLGGLIAELAETHRLDVIVLAECAADPNEMLRVLNQRPGEGFHLASGLGTRIVVFTRFAREFLQQAAPLGRKPEV